MASFSSLLALLFMVASVVTYPVTVTAATIGDHRLLWVPMGGGCEGSIEECMGAGGTLEMEMSRRILATSQYISYRALQRNTVPCSQRGASYYNCQPGAEANPYSRGCAAITRCRTN
ncbi:protein RALF-like 1 [Prosopis cineraria]|uniref:protein RALF-like 1 n=1 Tax=Prosopis cineraria TaxID=364024 RepID=UPI00240F9706|nr:protein RALF-like 1 [Prosopis cineraria]